MKKNLLLIVFILSCLFVTNVNADTASVSDTAGVNMRENPTISSNIIMSISYQAKVNLINTNGEAGNGCSKNWYYIFYNGNYGYVCSEFVKIESTTYSTSYNRPWTTPKKAIIGGAMFIGEDYISIGQFTSYLKKFNVNPQNLEHEIFNHQYMANLSAPYSESYSTYATLRDNNQLNNSYNFNIPIFTNMPNSTFNSSIRNITLSTAGVQDTQFENMISNFPDSYKQYLRYLHTIHQNWVFTPMITNIDFNTAVSREKNVSSINISSGLCDSPTVITESGWCIATSDAVSFYLDPRNFLNEKYIFMFEDLSYNEVYSETLVKGVLNGTFMSDMDLIDNQTYSSIFVEAGKTTNVSPVYLASLSRQETGTTISNTTNGAEFTYEGYTYSGLYNFFNIGAYSSATNPALAGLVFANGGAGINQGGTITPQTPVVIDNNYIEMLKLGKIGSYLKGYSIGTTFNTIKNIVGSRATVVIKNPNGTTISGDSPIGTGYQILMSNTSGSGSYIYVLYGDISGEGEINSADLLKLRQHLLGTNVLNGAYLEAANVTKDSEVNSADILKIRQYLLGSSNIEQ